MIREAKCAIAVCDVCGVENENGDGIIMHYDSDIDAISNARDCDWLSTEDGKLYCSECRYNHEENDDDD